jgi:riboflavin synthase
MFTGIIEETGIISSKKKVGEGFRFRVKSKKIYQKLAVSDSVNINGVCHTVTAKAKNEFEFTSVHETLKKTNTGLLKTGDEVNLESSLTLNKKIGGHFVFGHIDDTGIITSIKQAGRHKKKGSNNWEYRIRIHKKHLQYVINVGSIALNGVSLTVAEISKPKGDYFEIKISIIPYTYSHTTFNRLKVNDKVNLEFDFLGKYVLNTLPAKRKKNKSK